MCAHLFPQNVDKDTSETFSVQTSQGKGVISLIGKLDFERKSLYQLRVLAIVSTSSCKIFIIYVQCNMFIFLEDIRWFHLLYCRPKKNHPNPF